MESKRKNIYIVIFVITTIIASCVAVYFGIVGNKENKKLNQQISELNKKISEIEKSGQLKIDDTNKKNEENVTANFIPSDDEMISLIQNFLNLHAFCYASPHEVLYSTYLGYYDDIAQLDSELTRLENGYQTKIKYQDFKAKMLSYMTEELFFTDSVFKPYQDNNGMLFIAFGGASGGQYIIKDIKITSSTPKEIKCDFSGSYKWVRNDDITGRCILKLVNDKFVVDFIYIDQTNIPNDR